MFGKISEAQFLYDKLAREIPEIMKSVEYPKYHCFRIPIKRSDNKITHLSVSIPPDYNGVETALFKGSNIVYLEELGYGTEGFGIGVRRDFGTGNPRDMVTILDLVKEIKRLSQEDN
jgi:hypothetical protein